MQINKRINSDFKTLNEYNEIYKWIPNEYQIRPTEIIIKILFVRKCFVWIHPYPCAVTVYASMLHTQFEFSFSSWLCSLCSPTLFLSTSV